MAPQGSNIWEYFEKVPGDKKQDSVGKCNTCQKLIKAPGGTTSGLRKHLKTHPKLNKLLEDADKEKAKEKELEARKRKQVEKDDLDVELECQPSKKKKPLWLDSSKQKQSMIFIVKNRRSLMIK